jgi:hypothetical protein
MAILIMNFILSQQMDSLSSKVKPQKNLHRYQGMKVCIYENKRNSNNILKDLFINFEI